MSERKKMIASLSKGDKVLLQCGIYGTVSQINSDEEILSFKLSIGDKIQIEVLKSTIEKLIDKAIAAPKKL